MARIKTVLDEEIKAYYNINRDFKEYIDRNTAQNTHSIPFIETAMAKEAYIYYKSLPVKERETKDN